MTMKNKPRWIAHNQPNMPARLKSDTLVNVVFRDGTTVQCMDAGYFGTCWNIMDYLSKADIIAYQVAEQTK